MELTLPDSERVLLQQAQRACRGQAGYVPVTVLLMLDQGHAAATVAQALGMDASSVYRYAQTYQLHGLAGYLRATCGPSSRATGACSPAPNSPACAGNWTRRSTPIAGPLPTGWPAPTGSGTRFRA